MPSVCPHLTTVCLKVTSGLGTYLENPNVIGQYNRDENSFASLLTLLTYLLYYELVGQHIAKTLQEIKFHKIYKNWELTWPVSM